MVQGKDDNKSSPSASENVPTEHPCTAPPLSLTSCQLDCFFPRFSKPPLPTTYTPSWFCLFFRGIERCLFPKHRGSTERFPEENFLITLTAAAASEAIPGASPASSPSRLCAESRARQKSLSCLAFPLGQTFFSIVVDLACRI